MKKGFTWGNLFSVLSLFPLLFETLHLKEMSHIFMFLCELLNSVDNSHEESAVNIFF